MGQPHHELFERKKDFRHEIDLHIKALHADPASLSGEEMLFCQLRACEQFLQDAIMCGAGTVYIIHGVGKGRLRDEISRLLRTYREVKTFKNEYHAKYGFGATEVELK